MAVSRHWPHSCVCGHKIFSNPSCPLSSPLLLVHGILSRNKSFALISYSPKFLIYASKFLSFLRPRLLNLKCQKSGLPRHPSLEAVNADCLSDGEKDKGESFLLILGISSCRMPWLSCPILLTCFPLRLSLEKHHLPKEIQKWSYFQHYYLLESNGTAGALFKCF